MLCFEKSVNLNEWMNEQLNWYKNQVHKGIQHLHVSKQAAKISEIRLHYLGYKHKTQWKNRGKNKKCGLCNTILPKKRCNEWWSTESVEVLEKSLRSVLDLGLGIWNLSSLTFLAFVYTRACSWSWDSLVPFVGVYRDGTSCAHLWTKQNRRMCHASTKIVLPGIVYRRDNIIVLTASG